MFLQVCRRSSGGVGGAGEYVGGVVPPPAAPPHHLALTINQQRLRAAPYDNLVSTYIGPYKSYGAQ